MSSANSTNSCKACIYKINSDNETRGGLDFLIFALFEICFVLKVRVNKYQYVKPDPDSDFYLIADGIFKVFYGAGNGVGPR